ncbi:exonuclease domain-containing protein [Leuconostocaceae bacterium ESL0723]|nr:exonuclease domain-containing protein [Leuconostocaceae bacterium ESL0723]
MRANDSFVIVDLETTQPSVAKGGRIIQIGMSFIKNRQIVEHFDSLVNPGCNIDRNIQQLTHITNRDVQDAPYFEEVAPLLHRMLTDTVIVAHNVNFDYPFLNNEFKRTGFEPLDIEAIDTVQLAQILLPLAPGYRLVDLSHYLDLPLQQAHRANADAEATAYLLLALWQRASELPGEVKKQLKGHDWGLIRQTQAFLKLALNQPSPAKKNQDQTKPAKPAAANDRGRAQTLTPTFVAKAIEKRQQLGTWFESRPGQNGLMNRFYDFVHKRQRGVLSLISPAKSGKTLTYLYVLLLSPNAWPTLLLSNDQALMDQQVELMQALRQQLGLAKFSWAKLGRPRDYVDPQRLAEILDQQPQSEGHLWQARVLVWINQSQTGRFEEMPVTIQGRQIRENVASDKQGAFYQAAWQQAQAADVVLMDYATFWSQADALKDQRQLNRWPLAILEAPLDFVPGLQTAFQPTLPLQRFREGLNELPGLISESRGKVRQQLRDRQKRAGQLLQSVLDRQPLKQQIGTARNLVKVLMKIQDLVERSSRLANFLSDSDLSQLLDQLDWVRNRPKYVREAEVVRGGDDQAQQLVFEVDVDQIYQHFFLTQFDKVLLMADYLPEQQQKFWAQVPAQLTYQSQVSSPEATNVTLVRPKGAVTSNHVQLLAQQDAGPILIIVPNQRAVHSWYQRLRYNLPAHYQLVAEGLTASLEKLQRQYQGNPAVVMVVTEHFLDKVWQQENMLPAVVVIPDMGLFTSLSQLKALLTALEGHPTPVLVAKISNHMLRQLPALEVVNATNNQLGRLYHQILSGD